MQVILPQILVEDKKEEKVEVQCIDINGLYVEIKNKCPKYVNSIFNEEGIVRKNVILVINGKVMKKKEYESIIFSEESLLEILLQLAGG